MRATAWDHLDLEKVVTVCVCVHWRSNPGLKVTSASSLGNFEGSEQRGISQWGIRLDDPIADKCGHLISLLIQRPNFSYLSGCLFSYVF